MACEKLSVDIPIVMQDDVLLAHTIDETIGNHIPQLIAYRSSFIKYKSEEKKLGNFFLTSTGCTVVSSVADPDPHGFASFWEAGIPIRIRIKVQSLIRIRINVKSRIRIKVKRWMS